MSDERDNLGFFYKYLHFLPNLYNFQYWIFHLRLLAVHLLCNVASNFRSGPGLIWARLQDRTSNIEYRTSNIQHPTWAKLCLPVPPLCFDLTGDCGVMTQLRPDCSTDNCRFNDPPCPPLPVLPPSLPIIHSAVTIINITTDTDCHCFLIHSIWSTECLVITRTE